MSGACRESRRVGKELPAGDPAEIQEVKALQFMLIFGGGEYDPFERALRPADGVDGRNTWTALLDHWAGFQTAG